ncbi:MAG: hypothetical protein ACOYMG_27950 [Candidatus Methylumidiphilus sp.]
MFALPPNIIESNITPIARRQSLCRIALLKKQGYILGHGMNLGGFVLQDDLLFE